MRISRGGSSPLSACFHPSATAINDDLQSSLPSPSNPSSFSGDLPNPTTACHYHTNVGVFFLSWSQAFLRRSLHLHFYSCDSSNCYLHSLDCYRRSVPFTFRLEIKPLTFWRKHGSKKISRKPDIRVVWDLTRARFGSGPDPVSGFYVAVFVSGEVCLLVGEGNLKVKQKPTRQILVSRRENLFGNRVYNTKIKIKEKLIKISIDIKVNDDEANLRFSVDDKSVLKIKQLQWNFRGNTKIVIDDVTIQISWDVYNWLFGDKDKGKPVPAVFLLRFENQEVEGNDLLMMNKRVRDDIVLQKENSRTPSFWASSYGHWSSSRMSSVMEWSSYREEDERSFGNKSWFSLIVYGWRK